MQFGILRNQYLGVFGYGWPIFDCNAYFSIKAKVLLMSPFLTGSSLITSNDWIYSHWSTVIPLFVWFNFSPIKLNIVFSISAT